MKILIVSEGEHELGGALETIVRRLLSVEFDAQVMKVSDPAFRGHHGKGHRYFKRAIRCIQYAAERGFDAVVVLIDQDDEPDRRRQFSAAQDHIALTSLPRALGVAVKMFDAWILADEGAISQVLEIPVQCQPDPESIDNPKAVIPIPQITRAPGEEGWHNAIVLIQGGSLYACGSPSFTGTIAAAG